MFLEPVFTADDNFTAFRSSLLKKAKQIKPWQTSSSRRTGLYSYDCLLHRLHGKKK